MFSLNSIIDIRRRGASFKEVSDAILRSKHLLHEFTFLELLDRSGITPDLGYLDMASDLWRSLSYLEQTLYASDYQKWYVKKQGLDLQYNFLPFAGNTSIPMVLIPPGIFLQRYGPNHDGIERHIDQPFWCGKHKITEKQWWCTMMGDVYRRKNTNLPKNYVSWSECNNDFCNNASRMVHTIPITLLENREIWEYACLAGSTQDWSYFGGPELSDYGWFSENSNGKTHAVGKKRPNAWGLCDMLGNVCEWRADGGLSGVSAWGTCMRIYISNAAPLNTHDCRIGFRVSKKVASHLLKF